MNSRPIAVTIIAFLFIVLVGVGFLYHLTEFDSANPMKIELIAILAIRLIAVIAGMFLLRGANWARWTLALWMVYHLALSALHTMSEFLTHAALFGFIVFFLFRAPSNEYFHRRANRVSS